MAGASNVVRLPTAAKRKVGQPQNKEGRAARARLREETQWPGKYFSPGERESEKRAAIITSVERTPALRIVMALLSAVTPDVRATVVETLAKGAENGPERAIQAYETARLLTLTYGEASGIVRALERVDGEAQS